MVINYGIYIDVSMLSWLHADVHGALFQIFQILRLNQQQLSFFAANLNFKVKIICPGSPGHGSRFVENTPGGKAQNIINKLLEYRESEKERLEANPDFTLGDVTTVNLTAMEVL